jgi:hypothetical protein
MKSEHETDLHKINVRLELLLIGRFRIRHLTFFLFLFFFMKWRLHSNSQFTRFHRDGRKGYLPPQFFSHLHLHGARTKNWNQKFSIVCRAWEGDQIGPNFAVREKISQTYL